MTPGDAARVLSAAALYDNRTIAEADAAAWFRVIGDLDLVDAIEAVAAHYRESTERLMPAHVRRVVREIRADRRKRQPSEPRALPSRFEDDITRDIRMRRGQATCREILATLLPHLAARQPHPTGAAGDALRAITAGLDWPDPARAEDSR